MAQKSIQGSEELAKRIRQRRLDLKLTIEEAASRAGVGTKTWCRYEAGESIRQDKYKGICKALEWSVFTDQTDLEDLSATIREFKKHKAWSKHIEKTYGKTAAFSVAIGSDLLLDRIKEDLKEISTMPVGTHLGQLQVSFLLGDLPEQFLMKYNYDFLYRLKSTLLDIRERIRCDCFTYAENVMEEILIYLCCEEALAYVETCCTGNAEDCVEWVFEMFEDRDLIDYLYSEKWLGEGHPYHFGRWEEKSRIVQIDNTMKIEVLSPAMLIKNFVSGEDKCNYEGYLLEVLNHSNWFLQKYGGAFIHPVSESNGECDAINDIYQIDFKLLESKTCLMGYSVLSQQIEKIVPGVISYSRSKNPQGSILATNLHTVLRKMSLQDLLSVSQTKCTGAENDILAVLDTLKTKKNLLLFFPYVFSFTTPHNYAEAIESITNGLNVDFCAAFEYRRHVAKEYDTYLTCIYNDCFLVFYLEGPRLVLCDSVGVCKLSTYLNLLQYNSAGPIIKK